MFTTDVCWQNIRDCVEMTNFKNFYDDLLDLAKKYELKNIPLKIENDFHAHAGTARRGCAGGARRRR